ncbi:hypothetical protein XACW160_420015 [Xanthomonas citri pv. citri]|uniref:Uncharacterized protein n=1 Tax=Xanthomonas citri pv. citri TaxID=611301 RepID=A0A0U5FDQ9_XANCI|nr:hypothetical protein XAC9322_410016 [Xanthomonas citri pv. citri]CEE26227.1 hypothetical protein XAC3824_440015 [Xanthomonas citri pv. citri]CEE27771.1 hypothetical protein XAC1083_410015 [Xanthomonas citri pv. citri]CEE39123.1 hypothetical protein XAC902_530011 [Xanthomonas citri pv. citri]CEE39618.1 hypothetical protein XAC2911_380015 [Xanthomonas citri pv. citri]
MRVASDSLVCRFQFIECAATAGDSNLAQKVPAPTIASEGVNFTRYSFSTAAPSFLRNALAEHRILRSALAECLRIV